MSTQSRGQLSYWIAKTKNAEKWHRLAKGIESMDNAKNPQESKKTWIDDTSDSTITGFQPSWAVAGDIYDGDKASEMLSQMAWEDAKNDDAIVYLASVRGWKPGTAEGTFEAKIYECSWLPENEGGGAGGEAVTFSGALNAKGEAVFGAFNTATGKFVAK